MATEAEKKVLRTLAEAAVYTSLDTIKKKREAEMGDVWWVQVGFADSRLAINFQKAIDDVLQSPAPQPVVYVREVDAGTNNACWVICAKDDPGACPALIQR